MRFEILDVGHGFCAWLYHDNTNAMLFDCGHKTLPEFRPSQYLASQGIGRIDRFFVTNYDEDHISDLPQLRSQMSISILHRNTSISVPQLRALKQQTGPISAAMESFMRMADGYTGIATGTPAFPGVGYSVYQNEYPVFTDTNNLSSVIFLTCNGTKFVMPGDLENPGWQQLLANTSFRAELAGVQVFVASHHGRENGYCRDVFDCCNPNVIVFSDSPMQFASQEMANTYAQHASGITFNGQCRRVLSTRNDRTLTWNL